MLNDLRVGERLASDHLGRTHSVTCGDALPPFSGGEVVAGSNFVCPTKKNGV
jgi:hypothetical protein